MFGIHLNCYPLTMLKRIAFLIIVLFAFTIAEAQQTKEELQRRQQELQREINELNATLGEIQRSKKKSIGQLAIVQRKIAKRQELINSIGRDIRRIDDELFLNEREIYRLNKELDTLKLQYAQSIQFAYKNRGSYEYLNFLFSAKNFNDAVKRIAYLKSYRQQRETQAVAINKTQSLLQERMGMLAVNKQEKTKTLSSQSEQLKVLEEDKQEQAQVVKQLKDQEKDYQAQLRRREKERQDLRRALDAAIKREIEDARRKERERIARQAEAAKKAANNNATVEKDAVAAKPKNAEPVTGGIAARPKENREESAFESTPEGLTMSLNFEKNRGRLPWPVESGIVTGEFGTHTIPGTRLAEKNDGIIITTKAESSIRCVADGEVARIFDLGEYQGVMVRHGKYFTIYSRLSSVNVSKGQAVNAGTVIGRNAQNLDGDYKVEFLVMNDKGANLNPELWLKRR